MFSKSLNFFHKIRERHIAQRLCPEQMKHDDLYLVEYPKSGVTYLCHILGSMEFNSEEFEVNYFNVHSFIPDIHESKKISAKKGKNLKRRIIKSHGSYNRQYRYVIHLVRNPLDVMISYKNYWLSHWGKDIKFSELIRSWRGIPRWVRHTESWINSDVNQRYIPINYQALVDEPEKTIRYIYKCYGATVSDELITNAIEKSNYKNMQESEEFWNYGHRPKFTNAKFVGEKKFGKDSVSEEDLIYIKKNTSELYSTISEMCKKCIRS